jgi:quercetin dioxygenase-like cupin family protein
MSAAHGPFVYQKGEGEAIWFLGTLVTVKANSEQTHRAFTFIEQVLLPGFATPFHIHHNDDESFYVLEGTLAVTCGEQKWTLREGGFVYLPKGIVHGFTVEGDQTAKLLQITAPAGFERFAAELGEPARERTLPPAPSEPPGMEQMLALGKKYQLELAPPPADQHTMHEHSDHL